MLYLIATPIGNLGDITMRALEVLQACDYLLCEDTRRTAILLNHYKIKVPLKSFHLFNEKRIESTIIKDLQEGKTIGLVSDAGMPTLNDPGSMLVKRCQLEEIDYTVIPGPSSILTALASSGLLFDRFQFIGFLPKKGGKCKKILEESLNYQGVTLFFESPYRLLKTLKQLGDLSPEREIIVAKELTKKFEKIIRGKPSAILNYFQKEEVKGEFVVIISE